MNTLFNSSFFFTVNHIIKPYSGKLIYGIRYNDLEYFMFKSFGINDCEQLDSNPQPGPGIFNAMCEVITEIEKGYSKTPPLENINIDVLNILLRAENQKYDEYPKYPASTKTIRL